MQRLEGREREDVRARERSEGEGERARTPPPVFRCTRKDQSSFSTSGHCRSCPSLDRRPGPSRAFQCKFGCRLFVRYVRATSTSRRPSQNTYHILLYTRKDSPDTPGHFSPTIPSLSLDRRADGQTLPSHLRAPRNASLLQSGAERNQPPPPCLLGPPCPCRRWQLGSQSSLRPIEISTSEG